MIVQILIWTGLIILPIWAAFAVASIVLYWCTSTREDRSYISIPRLFLFSFLQGPLMFKDILARAFHIRRTEKQERMRKRRLCSCDSCSHQLTIHTVFAIGPGGDIPTNPSPAARGPESVYRLLCQQDFIKLYKAHGHAHMTLGDLYDSHDIAVEHLRLKGKLSKEQCENLPSLIEEFRHRLHID